MLIVLEGQVRADDGNWVGALDSYLTAIEYGAVIPRGGNLEGLRTGERIQSVARQSLQRALAQLDAIHAKGAVARLRRIDRLQVPFSAVLVELKWILVVDHMQILKDRNLLDSLHTFCSGATSQSCRSDVLSILMYSKKRIVDDLMGYVDQFVHRVREPYAPRALQSCDLHAPFFMADLSAELDDEWCQYLVNETMNRLLITALALRAYQLENDRLPASLSQLVPAYVNSVPGDPFAGGSELKYRKVKDAYVMYSIGPDGKDDGGRSVVFDSRRDVTQQDGIDSERSGDILFPR